MKKQISYRLLICVSLIGCVPFLATAETLTIDGDLEVAGDTGIAGALTVSEGIVIGSSTEAIQGAIRFVDDGEGNTDFQGYKNEIEEWVSFISGGSSSGGTADAASSLVVPGTSDVKLSVNAAGVVLLVEPQGDIPMFGQ